MIKKSLLNIGVILCVSVILIIGPSSQVSLNLFENNAIFPFNNVVKIAYGQDNSDNPGGDEGTSNSKESNESSGDEGNSLFLDDDGSVTGNGDGSTPGNGDGSTNGRDNSDNHKKDGDGNNRKHKHFIRDDDNVKQEIIIVGDKNTCPTQSDSVELTGIINSKGIRLLGDFYPCNIADGGITLNIPESPALKLAVMHIDYNGNNHEGALITPAKIQSINGGQGLYAIELDKNMKGIDPLTGESTILTKINGLAIYNSGDKPIVFKQGNAVALTAIFTK